MKIEIRQGGGIAGSALNQVAGPVDTEDHAMGEELEALVAESNFFSLPASLPDERRISDSMWYQATVEDTDRAHTVKWTTRAKPIAGLISLFTSTLDAAGGWRDARVKDDAIDPDGGWDAVMEMQPSGRRRIRVRGTVMAPSPNSEPILKRADAPGSAPDVLTLELTYRRPDGIDREVLTPKRVEFIEETEAEYRQVEIVPDGPGSIPVESAP